MDSVMSKRTKIVCTVGPGTDAPGVLERMIAVGMNVARFNFSHGTHEDHGRRMDAVKAASEKLKTPIALMLDTKGPEMRLGFFAEGATKLVQGTSFSLLSEVVLGDEHQATVSYPELWRQTRLGQSILLADGLVRLLVTNVESGKITTVVENTGVISDRKRVACPSLPVLLPALSEADKEDLLFGVTKDVDYVAASFIQRADDIVEIKRFLEKAGGSHIRVIAKIENEEGLRNIESIMQQADGMMVARGDLGVEIPPERVPLLQKEMISLCNRLGKPVITATQMLESMIVNPRPTRAETSDIANAILDGTDAIMLSGETANGKYPVTAVETMFKVAQYTERSPLYQQRPRPLPDELAVTTEAISQSTVTISQNLHAKAILTASESGRTALMVSKYRPDCPIVMVSPHLRSLRRASLYWGVTPIVGESTEDTDRMVNMAVAAAMRAGVIDDGDLVVITAGVPSGKEGTTNMIRVHVAGQVLLKGMGVGNGSATGKIVLAKPQNIAVFQPGDILVVDTMDEKIVPYVQQAGAIIAVEEGLTSPAAVVGLEWKKPTVVGVKQALTRLLTGERVTVDAARGFIYRGRVNAR